MLEDVAKEFLLACRRTVGAWLDRRDLDRGTLLLNRNQITSLMDNAAWLDAVTAAFRAVGDGRASSPPPMSIAGNDGAFHAKGARVDLDRPYVVLKLNGNFPGNRRKYQLPTIQGAILLCDGNSGRLLAVMDSIEVTLRRTAAATALAARYLAKPGSSSILICGCGDQAGAQLEALRDLFPLSNGYCFDRVPQAALELSARSISHGLAMTATRDLGSAAPEADIIVTCSSATCPFLTSEMVRAGTFIAAVGADSPGKSEIAPKLMASAMVVADSLDQCEAMGDLRHAIEAKAMCRADVHAELAELVGGAKQGRSNDDLVTLFDSTGLAIEDAAAAANIYERALRAGAGACVSLAS